MLLRNLVSKKQNGIAGKIPAMPFFIKIQKMPIE